MYKLLDMVLNLAVYLLRGVIVVMVIVALVGCLAEEPVVVDPTPTQEVLEWNNTCTDGRLPSNSNPCLFGQNSVAIGGKTIEYPNDMLYWFNNELGITYPTNIRVGDGGYIFDFLYYQGDAGFETNLLQLEQLQCYWAEAQVFGHFNVTNLYDAADNFHFVGFAQSDNGEPPVFLGKHPFVENKNLPTMTLEGERTFGFAFYSLDTSPQITIMLGGRANYGTAGYGSYIRIDSIGVYEVSEGHCVGAPTV